MTFQAQVSIRLEGAYLCECGLIGDSPYQCICGNKLGLMGLKAILDRPESTEASQRTETALPASAAPRNTPRGRLPRYVGCGVAHLARER